MTTSNPPTLRMILKAPAEAVNTIEKRIAAELPGVACEYDLYTRTLEVECNDRGAQLTANAIIDQELERWRAKR